MQFALFYPLDAREPLSPALQQGAENLQEFTNARIPTFLDKDAASRLHRFNAGPYLFARISLPKATKTEVRLRLRLSFAPQMRSHYWGLNIDLAIPRDPAAEITLSKNTGTGTPDRVLEEDFAKQLQVLRDGIDALLDPAGGARSLIDADIQTDARRSALADLLVQSARARRADSLRLVDIAKSAEETHFEALNAVPDGAPLVIRPGIYSRSWQLGRKRGTLTRAMAKHARLATPDEIGGAALREAGLSRHDALILGAAASAAVAAHPDMTRFFKTTQSYNGTPGVDASAPFHDSFENPEEVKARRKAMDVIWMQTTFPHRHHSFKLNDADAAHFGGLETPSGQSVNPNFPGQEVPAKIFSFTRIPDAVRADPLFDLDRTCGIWTVSERLADLLRAHEMGRNELRPVLFVDADKRHMENRYMPVLRENHFSVLKSRCPADIMASLNRRGVKDYEIAVDAARHGTVDLWFDGSVGSNQNPLLISEVLMRAIRREKLSVRIGLKRCDAM